jgi:hypothetical protein
MKNVLILASALAFTACASSGGRNLAAVTVAEEQAVATYDALNVREERASRQDGEGMPVLSSVSLKSVGGIACQKSPAVAPETLPTVICRMNPKVNAEAIYKAMNVPEQDLSGAARPGQAPLGAQILGKTAGGLFCKRTTVVAPNARPSYYCSSIF